MKIKYIWELREFSSGSSVSSLRLGIYEKLVIKVVKDESSLDWVIRMLGFVPRSLSFTESRKVSSATRCFNSNEVYHLAYTKIDR